MKRPLYRSECSCPEERLKSHQSTLSVLSTTLRNDKSVNKFCRQHQNSEMQRRNMSSLRRRRRISESNNFAANDRCISNVITLDETRKIGFGSCCFRYSSFLLVILCWLMALPCPTLCEEGPSPTPFVIPRFRVEPIEYRGGIVIPAIFLIDDPELNVTPSPVVATAAPTTKQPTNVPTRNPITTEQPVLLLPTDAPTNTFTPTITTIAPTTMTPIIVNTASPTTTPMAVTNSPSIEPSIYPSHAPTIVTDQPSIDSSVEPSFEPSASPIVMTLTPSTKVPSFSPSSQPAVVTIAPQQQQFVNVTVPLGFMVDVMVQTKNIEGSSDDGVTVALKQMEEIWEKSLLDYYTNAFSGRKGVRPNSVDLTISPKQRRRRTLRFDTQRWMQQTNDETMTVQAIGGVNFAVDELSVDPEGFVTRAQEELPSALTANQLQQAIDDAGANDIVTVVSEISTVPVPTEPETEDDVTDKSPSTNRRPSKAEVVLGFTLLILTIASLLFWAHVLWQKRKKRLRRRRLESLRKMQSLTYQSSLDQSLPPTATNNTTAPLGASLVHNRSTIVLPPEGSILKADTYEVTSGDEDIRSDESDPFARELQKAASVDRAAWEALERSKAPSKNVSGSVTNSDVGVARVSNVSLYDTTGDDSRDIGVEVQPRVIGSFPYGDENHNQSTTPVRLSTKNAVPWTVAGISLAPFAQRQNKNDTTKNSAQFSPYGDRTGRSLQESWDLDEFPVKDENGPSQFSFLYPLRRQDVNAETPDARRSPDSEVSVRDESLEVTSVGTPDYTNTAPIREMRREETNKDDESDNASQSAITASMLKELDDIANFVKQYEELKKSRSSVLHQSRGGLTNITNNQQSEMMNKSENVGPVMPSKYSVQTATTGLANPRFVKSRSDETSLGLSDEEEDDETASVLSQRLGISRISVERPGAAPSLTYKNSQDDPLQWEMDTADLSPFPSSDIDSLRYSPSQSFEKQQVAINFAKESLLDRAIPQYQDTLSDDVEDGDVPYVISTKDATSARAIASNGDPSKSSDMLGYLRKTISARRSEMEPQQQHDEGIEAVEARISPRVRSKDQNYNTIRSMFESKRTAPIIPPNESWQYAGSYTGTNTSSVVLDHTSSNISNNAMIGALTMKTSDPYNNDRAPSRSGGASYGSSTFSDPFQFDL